MQNLKWIQFRELYTDWVADWPNSIGIKEKLVWRGYSAWWSTILVDKDNYDNNTWLMKASNIVTDTEFLVPKRTVNNPSIGKLLRVFIRDVIAWAIVRIFFRRTLNKSDTYFLYFQSNIVEEKDLAYDRHVYLVCLADEEYGEKSTILLKLAPTSKFVFHPFQWKEKVNQISTKAKREVVVIDSFLTIKDLISVHWFTLRRFLWLSNKRKDKKFLSSLQIGEGHCEEVMFRELQRSFCGKVQKGLMLGAMLDRYLSAYSEPTKVVSYLEMQSLGRPVYFFSKRANSKNINIAVQHTPIEKNKLFSYHRKREFSNAVDEYSSPAPDYYFVHGRKATAILSEYYPSASIRTIGCLKFDNYPLLNKYYESENRDVKVAIKHNNEKIWLIAPTVGRDLNHIMEMFQDAPQNPKIRIFVSPHPHVSHNQIRRVLDGYEVGKFFEVDDRFKTIDLLPVADLVICCNSSIGLEAAIFGTPCIRIIDDSVIPLSDPTQGIIDVTNQMAFSDAISKFTNNSFVAVKQEELDEIVGGYFFKVDGNSADRFWTELKKIDSQQSGIEGV